MNKLNKTTKAGGQMPFFNSHKNDYKKKILKNPQKKKKLNRIIAYNVVTLILLFIMIFDVSLRNVKVDESNTYEMTGVISQVEKLYTAPNFTPIIAVTIGNERYNLLVNDAYSVKGLLNEIKVGTKATAKVTEFKTLVLTNKLRGEKIVVDLRDNENTYYDIEVENKYRKIDIIGISLIFGALWIAVFVLSFLYVKFIL